jgi:hypothetical protein
MMEKNTWDINGTSTTNTDHTSPRCQLWSASGTEISGNGLDTAWLDLKDPRNLDIPIMISPCYPHYKWI